ncbi:MAG TPA: C39 family peptidase [Anaerolineales bacterium]|jgi:tetratricopeptide (TPR) repeat protein|nr:C39 family peptidase [Anaerolineales bacterium]
MFKNFKRIWLVPIAFVILIGLYFVPPIRVRADRRIDDLRAQVKAFLNPPDKAVFVPAQQAQQDAIATVVQATMQASAAQTQTAMPVVTSTSAGPTPMPTNTPIPLPPSVNLPGVKYVDQRERWNYCAPANLTMALNFWGWKGNRDDIAKVVKPGENNPQKNFIDRGFTDKNVMPYELVDFVNNDTDYKALYRYGGDIQMIKTMLAAGFPIIAEKGYYEADYHGKVAWLGHYQFVTGYDDSTQEVIVQDTWNDGPNFHIKYDKFIEGWRSFDFLFIVAYPADRQSDVFDQLGNYVDANWAAQKALDMADNDIQTLTGIDLFFAWFAKGTSQVALQQYVDAAAAYDRAFSIYASLGNDDNERPYRIMWYETGPYFAYYYSNRYQDVINLANTTLNDTISTPTLEESLYWRGLAEYAAGDSADAINDVRKAVYYNQNMQAAVAKLQEWGAAP